MSQREPRNTEQGLGELLIAPLNRRRLMRLVVGAVGAVGVAPILAACGGGDGDSTEESGSSGGSGGSSSGGTSTTTGGTPSSSGSGSSGGGTPKPGGKVIIGRSGDSDSLDPQHTIAGISWQVFNNIYDPLVGKNMDVEIEGILAEKWEIADDGKTVSFTIRKGIKFHDGTDLNADAVAFSFNRLIDPQTNAPAASWISPLEKTEAVDEQTVKMTLKEPFSPLLGNMASAYFGVVSPDAVKKFGEDFGQNPVGTGPFKFKEWIAGQSITLERNPDYQNFHSYYDNKGAPYIEQLIYRNIPEEQTQAAAFETGEINMLLSVPPRNVAGYKDNSDVVMYPTESGTNINYVEFHTDPPQGEYGAIFRPPFDDVKVRQAAAYAINADEIIKSVLDGLATRNYGPMPTGNYGYDPSIEQFGYHFDQDKAKQLLDEAGWTGDKVRQKDGKPLEIMLWSSNATTSQKVAQVLQNQFSQVGFKVNIESMEVATLLGRLGKEDDTSNIDFTSWGWAEPDLLFMMTDTDSGVGYYRPEDYRKLVVQARQVSEPAERAKLYLEASKVFLEDVAFVPLWTSLTVVGARKEVKGFKFDGQGYALLWDISIES